MDGALKSELKPCAGNVGTQITVCLCRRMQLVIVDRPVPFATFDNAVNF